MEKILIQILNMGYQASIVIGVVIAARLVLYLLKAPKKYAYVLWIIPFIRMVCPVSIESIFSLLPQQHAPIKENIGMMQTPQIYTANEAVNQAVNQVLPQAAPMVSVNPMQVYMQMFGWLWLLGAAALIIYSVVSYIWLSWKLKCRIYVKDNIYYADYIHTPFVMGILKPCIYLPYALDEKEMDFVVAHENVHIRRKDHLLKMAAFVAVSVYWFQPLAWIAFILFCRDMEMSCDEAVMKQYGAESRKEYATTLLNLTTGKRRLAGIPLAFGEGNTKKRIKNIMNYKKTVMISVVLAVILIICLMAGLLTNPKQQQEPEGTGIAEQLDSEAETAEENTQSISEPLADTTQMIDIVSPVIYHDMNLGADDLILDYAGNGRIIFHGYFGLFVYELDTQNIIGAVDLEAIGCNMTQGDNYCEVTVSEDGGDVYLHPVSGTEMYHYRVTEQTLEKKAFSLTGVTKFDAFVDGSSITDRAAGFCSNRGVEFQAGGMKYYGYLASDTGTVGALVYIEDDMICYIFDNYFLEEFRDELNSGQFALVMKEISSTGAVYEIYNNSKRQMIYGDTYWLEKQEDGVWVDVPYAIENWGFNDIANIVEANESRVVEEDWEWLYGELPEGRYILMKQFSIERRDGTYETVTIGGEFEITGK